MFLFFAMQMFDQSLKIFVYRFSNISCDSILSFVFAAVTISSNVFLFFTDLSIFFCSRFFQLCLCRHSFLVMFFQAYTDFTISANVFQAVFVFFPIAFLFQRVLTYPQEQTNQLILLFSLSFCVSFVCSFLVKDKI